MTHEEIYAELLAKSAAQTRQRQSTEMWREAPKPRIFRALRPGNIHDETIMVELLADAAGLSVSEILGRGKTKEVAMARAVLAFILHRHAKISYMGVGSIIDRDHTTVKYLVKAAEKAIAENPHLSPIVDNIVERSLRSAHNLGV